MSWGVNQRLAFAMKKRVNSQRNLLERLIK